MDAARTAHASDARVSYMTHEVTLKQSGQISLFGRLTGNANLELGRQRELELRARVHALAPNSGGSCSEA
jgi:hypothetical protein